ncbi:MAG: MFS transporter [Candidatus Eisenbacteria bacterium]|nr:MFS transporter [Candidatus Eisenbacteria bacterium]
MQIDKKTLRWRFLVPLYLSSVAEGMCLTVTMFFIPLYVRRTFAHTSLLAIASIVAIPSGAMFVASNFWGALADYTRKLKPYLLVGLAGYGGCLYALSASHTTTSVVLAATISSLFFAALRPISQCYVTLLREGEKGRAIGDLMAFQSLGWLIGGIAGGYLFEPMTGVPVKSILVGGALFGAFVLILVAVLLKPLAVNQVPHQETGSWLHGMTADLRALYGSRALVATCILAGLCSGGVWVFFGNFSVFLTEYAKASTTLLGWAMALSTLLGMFTFGPSGRFVDRVGPIRVLTLAVASYAIVYGLVSLTKDPIFITICFCVPIYPLFNVSAITLTSELSGKSTRAGGLGVLAGVLAFALAAGTLVGGAIADYVGLAVLPRCTFGIEIACLAAAFASVRLFKVLPINIGRRGFGSVAETA